MLVSLGNKLLNVCSNLALFQNTTCAVNIQATTLFNSRNRHLKRFLTADSCVSVI